MVFMISMDSNGAFQYVTANQSAKDILRYQSIAAKKAKFNKEAFPG
ncbi:hypothetical protein [Sediminibacillus albus]|uniref:Uncharacterized protein n=1 Tax=Sediminibacillus albus TaxID=407036 RepID=A0A1G8X5H7_9BACI|nr:hypothetical protein [Sediminibacillus albus]SDJ85010.1 hypothetical protein SAMN05216243_1132 [Sediminibacillus albus]